MAEETTLMASGTPSKFDEEMKKYREKQKSMTSTNNQTIPSGAMTIASATAASSKADEVGAVDYTRQGFINSKIVEYRHKPDVLLKEITGEIGRHIKKTQVELYDKMIGWQQNSFTGASEGDIKAVFDANPRLVKLSRAWKAIKEIGDTVDLDNLAVVEEDPNAVKYDAKTSLGSYLALKNFDSESEDYAANAKIMMHVFNAKLKQAHALNLVTGKYGQKYEQDKIDFIDQPSDGRSTYTLDNMFALEGIRSREYNTIPDVDPVLALSFGMAEAGHLASVIAGQGTKLASRKAATALALELVGETGGNLLVDITATKLMDHSILSSVFGGTAAGAITNMTKHGMRVWLTDLKRLDPIRYNKIAKLNAESQDGAVFTLQQVYRDIEAGTFSPTKNWFTADTDDFLTDIALWKEGLEPSDPRKYMYTEHLSEAHKILKDSIEMGSGEIGKEVSNITGIANPKAIVLKAEKDAALNMPQEALSAYYELAYKVLGHDDFGKMLWRSDIYNSTMVPDIIFSDRSEQQSMVRGVLTHYLKPDGIFNFSSVHINDDVTVGGFKSWGYSPVLAGSKLSNVFEQMNKAIYFTKADKQKFSETIGTIQKGLSKGEMAEFNKAYTTGADLGERLVWGEWNGIAGLHTKDGVFVSGSQKVADSYFAAQMLEDRLWWYLNYNKVHQLRQDGVRKLGGTSELLFSYGGSRKTLTTDSYGKVYQEGDEVYTIFNPASKKKEEQVERLVFVNDENRHLVTDIPYSFKTIEYVEGHGARQYEDPFFVRTAVKDDKGVWHQTDARTANNFKDAEDFILGGEPLIGDTVVVKVNGKDVEVKVADTHSTIHKTRDTGEVAAGRLVQDRDKLKNLPYAEREQLAQSMREGGVPDLIISSVTGVSVPDLKMGFRFMRPKGQHLLDVTGNKARVRPALEALQDYASSVFSHTAKRPLVKALEEELTRSYSDLLDWSSGTGVFKLRDAPEIAGKKNAEIFGDAAKDIRIGPAVEDRRRTAQFLIDQLNQFQASKTRFEMVMDSHIENRLNNMVMRMEATSNPIKKAWYKSAVKFWEGGTYLGVALAQTRNLTAHAMLGMLNVKSAVVNVFNAVNVAALIPSPNGIPVNAARVTKGIRDAISTLYHGRLGESLLGVKPIAGSHEAVLWDEMQRSGILVGANFDGVTDMANMRIGKRAFTDYASDTSMALFKETEALQRMVAFSVNREILIEEIMSGKSKAFKTKDIGSDKFLAELAMRTDTVSFNMNNLNKPRGLREAGGLGATIFQFSNIVFKQMETQFFTNKLNFAQKAYMGAAWVALFGVSGLPGSTDLISAIETVQAKDWNGEGPDPAAVGALNRHLTEDVAPELAKFLQSKTYDADGNEVYDAELAEYVGNWMKNGYIFTEFDVDLIASATAGSAITALFANKEGIENLGPAAAAFDKICQEIPVPGVEYKGNWSTALGYALKAIGDEENRAGNIAAAKKHAEKGVSNTPFTSIKNAVTAYQAWEEGKFVSAKGKELVRDPEEQELLKRAFGFIPASLSDQREWVKEEKERTALITAYMNKRVDSYLAIVDVNGITPAILREHREETKEVLEQIGASMSAKVSEKGGISMRHNYLYVLKSILKKRVLMQIAQDPKQNRLKQQAMDKLMMEIDRMGGE